MTERRPPSSVPDAAHERAERLVTQLLSEQPPRKAPRTLESRVLQEIERRAALPWWRSSFTHWPIGAQFGFLLASLGAIKLALVAVVWAFTDPRSAPVVDAISAPISWAEKAAHIFTTLAELGAVVLNAVPSQWFYAVLIVAATLYVALFVLGATAYRTLYLKK